MRGETAARAVPTPASYPSDGPIDLDHLSRQTLGDSGLELEILRLFADMSLVYFERLETSTTVPDLLQHLHTLKGAALGVGAFRLAELARVAETELKDGRPVNPERIDDINIAVQEVAGYIAGRIRADAA